MQSIYKASVKDKPSVKAVAILDDFTLVGPVADSFECFNRFQEECAKQGLKLNKNKSFALWPYKKKKPPQELVELAAQSGIEIRTGAARILGAPIGNDRDFTMKMLEDHFKEQVRLHELLRHDYLPAQAAMILNAKVVRAKSNYLTRVVDPAISHAHLQRLDDLTLETFCKKLRIDSLPDVAKQQISLPAAKGGFGLTRFAQVAPRAFMASRIIALPYLTSLRPKRAADNSHFNATLKRCFTILKQQGVPVAEEKKDEEKPGFLPSSSERLWAKYSSSDHIPARLQHLWSTEVVNATIAKLLQPKKVDLRHGVTRLDVKKHDWFRARLRSCMDRLGSMWITTLPTEPGLRMSNVQYAGCTRMRLGLDRHAPTQCDCGRSIKDVDHLHACRNNRKSTAYQRHQHVLKALKLIAQRADFVVEEGPPLYILAPRPAPAAAAAAAAAADPPPPPPPADVDEDEDEDEEKGEAAVEDGEPEEDDGYASEIELHPDVRSARYKGGRRLRADLRVQDHADTVMIDVAISHPTCKSHFQQAALFRGATAAKRVTAKIKKYHEASQACGSRFVAFALESYGCPSKDAEKYLKHVAGSYSDGNKSVRIPFLRWARSLVSVALQHGNARVLRMMHATDY